MVDRQGAVSMCRLVAAGCGGRGGMRLAVDEGGQPAASIASLIQAVVGLISDRIHSVRNMDF